MDNENFEKIQNENIKEFRELVGKYIPYGIENKLIENGFFIKPASIKYHGNYSGALFRHSCEVARELADLTKHLSLSWNNYRSPYIVGMFHDLCKTDDYIWNEEIGNWNYNKNCLLTGHGDKSVILTQKYFSLTEEEMLCIRWHMGAFDDKDNWNRYGAAIEKYPNVLYTHTADMIAARITGV